MAIFHCYVSSPEGSSSLSVLPQVWELKEGGEIKEYEVSTVPSFVGDAEATRIIHPESDRTHSEFWGLQSYPS